MERPWERLTEPFDHADERLARHLLAEHWGIHPDALDRLDSERDDTFHVVAGDDEFTLKLSHPGDDPHLIGMQSAAMLAVANAGLPVAHVVPSVDGSTHPMHGDRVVWLLTWLPGDLALGNPELPEAAELGRTLGALNAALKDFEHPAAHRTFAWDLAGIAELEDLLHLTTRTGVADAIRGVPDVTALPQQVIHGDFHPGNVLVRDRTVVGILDFGDMLHTARVVELAIALAYQPRDEWDAFITGFESVVPLTAQERDALEPLARGRIAQRVLLGSYASQGDDAALAAFDRIAERLD